jgi:Na+-transporting NADH:ubiquinone oxidoreductase subunit C
VLLAVAAEGLKPRQQANIILEEKKNILSTVMAVERDTDINAEYDRRVRSFVINSQGEVIEGANASEVVIAAEYRKPSQARNLPVYEVFDPQNPEKVDFVVIPMYGFGLWDNIWGFVSLKPDMSTINGVSFQHAGETPGLGSRIAEEPVQRRFIGKQIFEGDRLNPVMMMKGEGNDYSNSPNKVDGLSGATLTAKGVNAMFVDYMTSYQNFLTSRRNARGA